MRPAWAHQPFDAVLGPDRASARHRPTRADPQIVSTSRRDTSSDVMLALSHPIREDKHMLPNAVANELTDRTALTALLYSPDDAIESEAPSLSSHVSFVVDQVEGIPAELQDALRDVVTATIVDPTNHREIFYRFIADNVIDDEQDA